MQQLTRIERIVINVMNALASILDRTVIAVPKSTGFLTLSPAGDMTLFMPYGPGAGPDNAGTAVLPMINFLFTDAAAPELDALTERYRAMLADMSDTESDQSAGDGTALSA